ncbi:hypothetical protein SAMN04488109_6399 [Chryseolinea serpens]|uniref:Uncharacterized protein n=1 Tax=Chryseolinea serpens TaxID=947013 RepID=A0A1M5XCS6_9BACT|nr:hypothetical protein SAMN04488109_6399 [Chryseolinea serpens]
MKGFFSFLVNCALLIFTLFVSVVIILYLSELFGKITEPPHKTLRYEEFAWLGLILIPFAFLGFLALRYFFRRLKKEIGSGPHGWR